MSMDISLSEHGPGETGSSEDLKVHLSFIIYLPQILVYTDKSLRIVLFQFSFLMWFSPNVNILFIL